MAELVNAGTDYTITATLRDSDDALVSGGTGTVTVKTPWGRELGVVIWPEPLTDQGDGTYTYTLAGSLTRSGHHYRATVKFTDPGEAQATLTLICR